MSIAHPRHGHEFATLGGGCFWCLEAAYIDLNGVVDVESGYSGGTSKNPTYNAVCSGTTDSKVVTQLAPALACTRAEDHHQEYFANNPNQGYCAAVVGPKVAKFRKTWAALRK